MLCFAYTEKKGCGEATHLWLQPVDEKADRGLLTVMCDGHAAIARERGYRVRPMRSKR